MCDDCGMSQLNYTVPPDILYQQDYPYESSTTFGKKSFFNFAKSVSERFHLGKNDLAIDIGSNVELACRLSRQNCQVLGIEPSANISAIALRNGIETINDLLAVNLSKSWRATVKHQ